MKPTERELILEKAVEELRVFSKRLASMLRRARMPTTPKKKKRDVQADVLAFLGLGSATQNEIRDRLDLTEGQCKGALRRLRLSGKLRQVTTVGTKMILWQCPPPTLPLPFAHTAPVWDAVGNGLAHTKPANIIEDERA